MDTFVQAKNNSNTALQKGQSKPNQCSESEAADCLDHRQPEIRTKSPDITTSESAADFGYPEPIPAGHMRDQLISPLDSRGSLLANQDSDGPEHSSSDSDHVPLLPGLHAQSERTEAQHTQCSSDLLANAGDHECPIPNTGVTETERVDYAEDLMQNIRSRVLVAWKTRQSAKLKISLMIPCNVREFMEKQFAGSNENLGRVITLSGTATCGQATTCSDYISSNWPLRGLWILSILQDTFDGAKGNAEGRNIDLQIYSIAIITTSVIKCGFIGSKEAAIDIVQLLVWFGAAFQISSGDQLQHSQSKLRVAQRKDPSSCAHLTVKYEKSPVRVESCWFSLFNNPVIAQGFPVPERSNSERGLELPIELMATLGGGRHAVDFEGGLVIKGHSIAFVPIKQYEDTIQWHMVSNSDGTRLRYSDLKMHLALQNEVDHKSIRTKRAILGWSQVAQSFLGREGVNYEGIDWSEAKEAGRSTRLSGGGLGFQSNLIGQLNFALGAKDGRLLLSQNGPLEKIVDLAEKTPVALYDHHDKRAWLVPALEVILHVIHTRANLNLYKLDKSKTQISYSDETAKISDQAARRAVMASKDQQLYEGTSPGEKAYYVRDATLDIWSLLERMMERDAVITSAPGVAVRGTMRDKLYGWEFRALVEDKNSFRQKEQVLEKSNGGWVDLVDDTDTIVLFGNGFGEVIKPVRDSVNLCSVWKVLPKGRDYLAVGCPMLETLYNEAGSHKTRSYLTSRHLQWHRGSTLFERCEEISGCACHRLQQLVYDSWTTFRRVKPPDELPEDGCVIFGRVNHPIFPARRTCSKKRTIYSIPNGPLSEAMSTEPKSTAHLPTTSPEFRPIRNEMPDRNDLSSMFDMSSSTTDSQSESKLRMLTMKRSRKIRGQGVRKRDSLNGRQKKHSLRQSSLQGALKSPKKITRNRGSNLENKDNNEVRSFPPDDKDPLGQASGRPCGNVTLDDYMHWQSHLTLETDSGDGKGVEMQHTSMAFNCSK
ncbi:hypothetical protein JMJ35_010109 [Cladonia borealis]|uniref:Uncharacterized protein n=1 Tax=Cladonia borealis TaxID=184061 RepID=A0AA39QSE2_9LECA|nr:hypothetical protein JMJ35_010109 [Cladonia borealis]